jgi:hypothetical protein
MFNTYGVVIAGGEKHRHFLGGFETIREAKHRANCAVSGNASYAYVKDMSGCTVFHLMPPTVGPYGEGPLDPDSLRPTVPSSE